jgi:hypothetical protein
VNHVEPEGISIMASFLALCFVIFLVSLPFRLALRRRARVATPPPVVVVVVQPAGAPPPPLTVEQEWERIQARDA